MRHAPAKLLAEERRVTPARDEFLGSEYPAQLQVEHAVFTGALLLRPGGGGDVLDQPNVPLRP